MLAITAYGHPVLKKTAEEIDSDYPGLDELIEDMFSTMFQAKGVGLAAPQVNKLIRLFVVDTSNYAEEYKEAKDFKKAFINPIILSEEGKEWAFEEGCLSIPEIRENVLRKPRIRIEYYDENFDLQEEEYDGINARVIQHEYDHLDGKVFIDHISSIRKMLLKARLNDISKGNIEVFYKMKFPFRKKGNNKTQ